MKQPARKGDVMGTDSSSDNDGYRGSEALDKNASLSSPPQSSDFMSDVEVCEFLGVSLKTLRGRISRGTDHPPATEIRRGKYIFDRKLFGEWVRSKNIKWQR